MDYVERYRRDIKKRFGMPSKSESTSKIKSELKKSFLVSIPPFKSNKLRNRFKRKLYGYTINNKKKIYFVEGLFKNLDCEEINGRAFFVPNESAERMLKFLKEQRIDFEITKIWKE